MLICPNDFFAEEERARKKADENTGNLQKVLNKGDYLMKDPGLNFPYSVNS